MSETIISASIIGGIGDIIFGLEGFKEIKIPLGENVITKCYLCTHAGEGRSLVRANPYVNTITTIIFSNDFAHFQELSAKTKYDINYLGDAKNFCYTLNPEIFTDNESKKQVHKMISRNIVSGKIIILHPCGSSFSRYFLGEKRQVSTKELDILFWKELINNLLKYNVDIVLLGNSNDKDVLYSINNGEKSNVHIISGDLTLLESIEFIKRSNVVIGVDSFAKSISLACKIPTVVLVNDHDDQFRDDVFLNPYKKETYAKIIHEANTIKQNELITEINNFVEGKI